MRKDTGNFILSSEYDLRTAEHMFTTGRYIYVVFMCHLCIEKMLKAIVAEVIKRTPPKTHNLIYLLKLGKVELAPPLLDFVAKINNASIVTRYPEDSATLLDAYPKRIVQDYLKNTREVIQCLKQNQRLKE